MKIVPFELSHLSQINPREAVDMRQVADAAAWYSGTGPAYTILDGNERVIGALGVSRLWGRVGEAWSVFSEEVARHPIFLHKIARLIIRDAWSGLNLDRLQTSVLASSKRNRKWIERLGFHSEGIMRKFGPNGEDYVCYVKLGEVDKKHSIKNGGE